MTASPSGTGTNSPAVVVAIIAPSAATIVTVAVAGSVPVTVIAALPASEGLILPRGVTTSSAAVRKPASLINVTIVPAVSVIETVGMGLPSGSTASPKVVSPIVICVLGSN
jgi:hypothetical protein